MNHQSVTEHYNKGLQYARSGKWDEAMEFLGKAIAENPRHVNSYNVLGKVYIQKEEVGAARECWHRVLRIDPDNATAKQCLAKAGKGFGRIQLRRLLWPAVVVISLFALVITNYILLRRIGDLEIKLAKATINQIADDTPETPGLAVQETGQSGTSRPEEQPSNNNHRPTISLQLETDSQVTAAYNQAMADCRSQYYSRAMEIFRRMLEYPQSHELKDNAQYWLAECYYAQRNYSQALEEFQEVKRLFPKANKVFDAELKIAHSYYQLGQIQEAQQQLMQLSKDWPQQQYRSRIAFLSKVIQSSQTD